MSQVGNYTQCSLVDFYKEIQYCVLPGRYSGSAHRSLYSDLYRFWRVSWAKAFFEINKQVSLPVNEFFRHEEVTCLTYKNSVVACALIGYFDIDNPVHLEHQYFENYPEEVLHKIKSLSNSMPVFTFGYLAIDPTYRKDHMLADIIVGLAVRRIQESENPLMITYTRNSRKTNDLGYRLGAKAIAKNHIANGESSDFIYFDSSSMQTVLHNEAINQINDLWRRRVYVPSAAVITKEKERPNEISNELENSL